MLIELTKEQILMVAQAGIIRHLEFLERKATPQYGLDANTKWELQIEGVLSEYALSKYLGIHWEGSGVIDGDDVGKEEVRATKYDNGNLIIRPRDKDNQRYWLLTGENGKYKVRGYMYARDAKQPKYLDDKGNGRTPVYFVPQSDLVKANPWDI